MLWMFGQMFLKQGDAERTRNEVRLDKRDDAMRLLESDIRNKFSSQLQENTNAMLQHSKIMERVVDVLAKSTK